MSSMINLNTFATNHETAISWISQQLTTLGLVVKPSFDLQVARSAHTDCTCPHHGTVQCDCQIVVLLVYAAAEEHVLSATEGPVLSEVEGAVLSEVEGAVLSEVEGPVSLVVHSQDGNTYLSMVASPNSERENKLVSKIIQGLGYQNINITQFENGGKNE